MVTNLVDGVNGDENTVVDTGGTTLALDLSEDDTRERELILVAAVMATPADKRSSHWPAQGCRHR